MPEPSLHVVAIGNAIVDVLSRADEAFLETRGIPKGSMQLIDGGTAAALYADMGPGVEASGGSAANTMAGLAALGCRAGFIGQVADDPLGQVFAHDLQALGVRFNTAPKADPDGTGRCLVLVTPDGQRTMNTLLGAAQHLDERGLDRGLVADAAILYLEGYLWDPAEARDAMRAAIEVARAHGRQIAFSLSDTFVVERHRADIRALLDGGLVDILFANEGEILALMQTDDFDHAVGAIGAEVPLLVVTRGAAGAVAIARGERVTVPAEPIDQVVDTTGAGDLFAAGFLSGHVEGRPVSECLTIGAVAAAEIISHFGARPEADLQAIVARRFGAGRG